MSLWKKLGEHISAASGRPFSVERHRSLGGGCINAAYLVEGSGERYFVKTNQASAGFMFEAEAAGLEEIARSRAIRVPRPVCAGQAEGFSWLVLEYVEMGGGGDAAQQRLGRQVAAMHRATAARYGWSRDNTIGSTPQINTQSDDWAAFWRANRLDCQLRLAEKKGTPAGLLRRGERLAAALDAFFSGYEPPASLLHGDLWGGNYDMDRDGAPVLFDPAVYYGDRETDIAMTELFGGFSPAFYAAYREAFPLDPGYPVRKHLYSLYHILNHFNLFGGGYGAQAESMIDGLLAEIR